MLYQFIFGEDLQFIISTVESLRQNPIRPSSYGRVGGTEIRVSLHLVLPILDAVEEISSPLIREKIADRLAIERTWTD